MKKYKLVWLTVSYSDSRFSLQKCFPKKELLQRKKTFNIKEDNTIKILYIMENQNI